MVESKFEVGLKRNMQHGPFSGGKFSLIPKICIFCMYILSRTIEITFNFYGLSKEKTGLVNRIKKIPKPRQCHFKKLEIPISDQYLRFTNQLIKTIWNIKQFIIRIYSYYIQEVVAQLLRWKFYILSSVISFSIQFYIFVDIGLSSHL
jgi:hypothetical protein